MLIESMSFRSDSGSFPSIFFTRIVTPSAVRCAMSKTWLWVSFANFTSTARCFSAGDGGFRIAGV